MTRRLRAALWRSMRHAASDASGMAAIEFALLAIPFLGLLVVILETGLVFLFGLTIDNATEHLARLIQTGQVQQAGITTTDALRSTFLCPPTGPRLIPSFVPCSGLVIDVRTSNTFATADVSHGFYKDPSSLQFCPGGAGSIVAIRVAYALPVFMPTLAILANGTVGQITSGLVNDVPGHSGWVHLLASAEVFQNEQTAGGNASCS